MVTYVSYTLKTKRYIHFFFLVVFSLEVGLIKVLMSSPCLTCRIQWSFSGHWSEPWLLLCQSFTLSLCFLNQSTSMLLRAATQLLHHSPLPPAESPLRAELCSSVNDYPELPHNPTSKTPKHPFYITS